MLGEITRKCKVVKETPTIFRIILVQGLNRQIRRMCEHFHYDVVKLERVRIMNIKVKGLSVGEWRDLTAKELAEIFRLTADSSSNAKKTGTKPKSKKVKSSKIWYADKPKTASEKNKKYSGRSSKNISGKNISGSKGGSKNNMSRTAKSTKMSKPRGRR
jgi:23S rRNA pseudouridine2604 synthase